jgi:curved DNA-binding protein CbpA
MDVSGVVLRELTFLSEGKGTLCWDGPDGQKHFSEIRVVTTTESGICAECPGDVDFGGAIFLQVQDSHPMQNAVLRHPDATPAPEAETDYYEVLQISPNAEYETIHRVHHIMAARFHPDNPETGDLEKFLLMRTAYQVLSNPELRAEHDAARQHEAAGPDPIFALKDFVIGIDAEKNRRLGVLSVLYNQRRVNPQHPGVSVLDLEKLMAFPREHLEFTMWYLRSKKFITVDDASAYTLTALGVDYVEANAPANALLEQLLRRRSTWATASSQTRLPLRNTQLHIEGANTEEE